MIGDIELQRHLPILRASNRRVSTSFCWLNGPKEHFEDVPSPVAGKKGRASLIEVELERPDDRYASNRLTLAKGLCTRQRSGLVGKLWASLLLRTHFRHQ